MTTLISPSRHYQNRCIVVPLDQDDYAEIVEDASRYRQALDRLAEKYPELFPEAFLQQGYRMKDKYCSKTLSNLVIRRIESGGIAYTVRPSFVLPHLRGWTKDTEHAMFMRKFGVPFWALGHSFGRDQMYWFRLAHALSRYNLVDTTVRTPQDLPEHLVVDEKHTWLQGDKVFVATTCGTCAELVEAWAALLRQAQHMPGCGGGRKRERGGAFTASYLC